jgi:hypothetical protein
MKTKKLVLSKETVRVLQDAELQLVGGGQPDLLGAVTTQSGARTGMGPSHPCPTTTVSNCPDCIYRVIALP